MVVSVLDHGSIVGTARRLPRLAVRLCLRRRIIAAGLVALAGLTAGSAAWAPARTSIVDTLLDRAFDRSLANGERAKPWPWAGSWPEARIEMPGTGRQALAMAGVGGSAFGPVHVADTPEAGDTGTAVYDAGDVAYSTMLQQAAVGDEIVITHRTGRRTAFRVTGIRVVTWDVAGIDPRAPGRRLALAIGWPFGTENGPYRYLVEAEAVDLIAAR